MSKLETFIKEQSDIRRLMDAAMENYARAEDLRSDWQSELDYRERNGGERDIYTELSDDSVKETLKNAQSIIVKTLTTYTYLMSDMVASAERYNAEIVPSVRNESVYDLTGMD